MVLDINNRERNRETNKKWNRNDDRLRQNKLDQHLRSIEVARDTNDNGSW